MTKGDTQYKKHRMRKKEERRSVPLFWFMWDNDKGVFPPFWLPWMLCGCLSLLTCCPSRSALGAAGDSQRPTVLRRQDTEPSPVLCDGCQLVLPLIVTVAKAQCLNAIVKGQQIAVAIVGVALGAAGASPRPTVQY